MVTLICGEESYLAENAYKKAKEKYGSVFCFDDFDEKALARCEEMDLLNMGQVRGVFVHVDRLDKNGLLENYLKNPNENCDLFVYANHVNKALKVYKAFKNVETYNRVNMEEMRIYVIAYLKKHNANISQSAFTEFIERVGYFHYKSEASLFDVFTQLSKLVGRSCNITDDIVKECVCSQNADAFALAELYMNREYGKMLQQIDILSTEKGFSSIRTLSLLFRNWRCGYLKRLYGKGAYGLVLRNDMGREQLLDGMKLIQEGIQSIKNGKMSDRDGLKIIVLRMIAGETAKEEVLCI